jgi:phosphohistidine phosphatase
MHVYLIRHGIAVSPELATSDRERWLTDRGILKTKAVAKQLVRSGLKFDLILSSPLVRAVQTAKILRDVGLSDRVEIQPELAPGGSIQAWLESWPTPESKSTPDSIALVGHEPDLSQWAELLIFGEIKHKIILKKAGTIGIQFPTSALVLGQGSLHSLIPPRYLQ